ncbi:MAG: AAA family ATPase [Rhodospirillum sp.]|nr:AAA family ATPase [Rhodospirillum sp.]MCF8487960.1 AAA family ATPase [Rhodospirillum sp.]MCF8499307.1 AAA family ATPase [Rhodospirillum sp.]
MPLDPLPPSALRAPCDADALPFASTAELDPLDEPLGQERAVEAVRFAIGMQNHGYNLFALGPKGTGKMSLINQFLADAARERPTPGDWVYVHNFDDSARPRALCLPSGRADSFRKRMDRLVEDLAVALPAAFEGEEFQSRMKALETDHGRHQEEVMEILRKKAEDHSFLLVRTEGGLTFAPAKDGEALTPEAYNALPEQTREAMSAHMKALQKDLEESLKDVPKWEKERREAMKAILRDVARGAAEHLIEEIRWEYSQIPAVVSHLNRILDDVVDNVGEFLGGDAEEGDSPADRKKAKAHAVVQARKRLKVNPLTTNGVNQGAPVVVEDNPTQPNLIGRVEHLVRFGALTTDFTLVKGGALHRANGGFLVLEARRLLLSPFAYEDLKRALRAGQVKIEAPAQTHGVMTTITLEPEPVPLDVKVILLGDAETYYLLSEADPEFRELFKVAADFDTMMKRTDAAVLSLARLLAGLVARESLRPLDRTGIAQLVERAGRLADESGKLTAHMGSLTDLAREADYFASKDGSEMIEGPHVIAAVEAQERREGRVRDLMLEEIVEGTIRVDTEGQVVGQINGLAVYHFGRIGFGRPTRITCAARVGRGEVVDIEREVDLGGPLHSKGVLILTSFLATRFAVDGPLSLSASLVFEQSYGEIEGDSASSTELYALLSALGEVPIRQNLAVTGSVDQFGNVQPIGGVNEKVEGFFDVCVAKGLTGDQGVLIPRTNVRNLMLRQDVVDACAAGTFHIYAVHTVDQGIRLLTGLEPGERGRDGHFTKGSLNDRVAKRLDAFARRANRDHGERNGRQTKV